MSDIGTLITNCENDARNILAYLQWCEEKAASILQQYQDLGGNTATDAWFTANPDAKDYSATQKKAQMPI